MSVKTSLSFDKNINLTKENKKNSKVQSNKIKYPKLRNLICKKISKILI